MRAKLKKSKETILHKLEKRENVNLGDKRMREKQLKEEVLKLKKTTQ